MEIPRYWRTTHERMRLVGSNCKNCMIKHFPPREVCPDCGHRNSQIISNPNGTIYASTEAQTTTPVNEGVNPDA